MRPLWMSKQIILCYIASRNAALDGEDYVFTVWLGGFDIEIKEIWLPLTTLAIVIWKTDCDLNGDGINDARYKSN